MKSFRGFTLIELLITVTILGVLASYAFQSYQGSVRKSNRAEGKAELMDVAQRLQRCFTTYGRYEHDDCAVATTLKNGNITSRGRGFYEVSAVLNTTTYALTAAAVLLPQKADTGCTALTLDNLGAQGPAGCW